MNQTHRLVNASRRRLLQAGAAIGGLQLVSPFIIKARGETPVKIGFIDPITGSLSALAVTEVLDGIADACPQCEITDSNS